MRLFPAARLTHTTALSLVFLLFLRAAHATPERPDTPDIPTADKNFEIWLTQEQTALEEMPETGLNAAPPLPTIKTHPAAAEEYPWQDEALQTQTSRTPEGYEEHIVILP